MKLLLSLFIFLNYNVIVAQDTTLFNYLMKADSVLFEQGFNRCNLNSLQKIIHQDLQFFHDQSGMQNREEFFQAIKTNICSGNGRKPIRKLVSGSVKVFPLYDNGILYGAIQMGEHEFFLKGDGKMEKTSFAKFIHTWILHNDEWQLYHVMSYDHQNP